MDANWFEDPLGRYDGRFFDGVDWTAQVSQDGILKIDPDFPPAAVQPAAVEPAAVEPDPVVPEAAVASVSEAPEPEAPQPEVTAAEVTAEVPAVAAEPEVADPIPADFELESSAPAVAPLQATVRQATTMEESPARTVAVLDESVVEQKPEPAHQHMPGASPAAEEFSKPRHWLWLGLLLALVGIGAVIFALTSGGSSDPALEDRVEDLESGGVIDPEVADEAEALGAGEPEEFVSPFGPGAELELGELVLLNGRPVLEELTEWHVGFADDDDVELGPDAGCWFSTLADKAIRVVQCGPVGGDRDDGYLFDVVPLQFDTDENGTVISYDVDDVRESVPISNAAELVGDPDGPEPPQ